MSQLTRTTWDSTYNSSGSGSFKNNTSQLITEAVMRQFAKDSEDSLAFLSNSNIFNVSNNIAITINGNTTSNNVTDFYISRLGVASLSPTYGSCIQLQNNTSTKAVLLQNSDDIFQMFNYSGSWTETLRINSLGLMMIGNLLSTAGAVVDSSILGLKFHGTCSDTSVFHIGGFFESEQTAANAQGIQGLEGYVKCSHSSGSVSLALGTIGNIELASTQTITEARSIQGGGTISAAGTITTWSAIWGAIGGGSGTITNGYGLYIDNFSGTVTNKFGIYIADSSCKNILHGKLNLADLPTSSAGLVTGDIWVNSGVLTRV